jgi:hypothetical protein
VTAFLVSGIAGTVPGVVGQPYRDASGIGNELPQSTSTFHPRMLAASPKHTMNTPAPNAPKPRESGHRRRGTAMRRFPRPKTGPDTTRVHRENGFPEGSKRRFFNFKMLPIERSPESVRAFVGCGARGRRRRVTYETIQTEAAANPGNFPGPAVDRSGQVVGRPALGWRREPELRLPIQRVSRGSTPTAGLSPLPHLRRRADPPLLACLLTRLAMRDRNRDTRPALRQQAVGGGGGRLCGRPPPRCLKLATVEDLRPGSGRALPGRKASASLRVRRTPLPRRTALAASYLTRPARGALPLHQLLTNAVTVRFWRSSFQPFPGTLFVASAFRAP